MKKFLFLFIIFLFGINSMEPPGASNKAKEENAITEKEKLILMGKELAKVYFSLPSKTDKWKNQIKKGRRGYHSE